jgi:hypothetical protein
MERCETCGNQYEAAMEIRMAGETHYFDSFECAIHRLAPRCNTCGIAIVGHGVEADGMMFCCSNCARQAGAEGTRDHA